MTIKNGIREVAEKAGVSIGTVSKILNPGSGANIRVSQKTREIVEKAANELNYQPSYGAKLLRGESSQTIGFAASLPDDHNYAYLSNYTFRLLNGIGRAASEHGYQVLLLNGVDYRRFLDVKRLDALILTGFAPVQNPRFQEMNELYSHFIRQNYPFAVISGHGDELPVPRVTVDNGDGMRQVAEFLCRKGISDVGFVGELTSNPQYDHQQRLFYLQKYLKIHDIELNLAATISQSGGDVPDLPRVGRYSQIDGYAALEILHRRHAVPRCLVCGNDAIAMGLLKCAAKLKLRVPEDLAVIGFDDDPDVDYLGPGLTTLHHPVEEFGKIAAEFVIQKIQQPDIELNLVLKPTLIERGTV